MKSAKKEEQDDEDKIPGSSEEHNTNENGVKETHQKISVISVDTINGRLNPLLLNIRKKMKEICEKSGK